MEQNNFAAYSPGTFSMDISRLKMENGVIAKSDMPAFVQEYCHYVQDVTMISSIFGFSLLLRDLVSLTQVFSKGHGENISIPLARDKFGETINKFRKYYNLYCGDGGAVFVIDYDRHHFTKRHFSTQEINLDGKIRILAVNKIELSGRPNMLHFGLIALQEIHAFYAQQLAERQLSTVEFSVCSTVLPSFPYQFGDFLFKTFDIDMDLESKFILIDLCLDTLQAPSVFLDVLEKLRGQAVTYFGENRQDFFP